jgi:hypothetical protein
VSSYAKQFLERMPKPLVDAVEGLSPAVAIEQKNPTTSSRSTVGTATEIYDFLRLLWARVGTPYCRRCGAAVKVDTVQDVVDELIAAWGLRSAESQGDARPAHSALRTPHSAIVITFPCPLGAPARRGCRCPTGGRGVRARPSGRRGAAPRHTGRGRAVRAGREVLVIVDRLAAAAPTEAGSPTPWRPRSARGRNRRRAGQRGCPSLLGPPHLLRLRHPAPR